MDVVLELESMDLHEFLSTYNVEKEVKYQRVITTLDDVEHPFLAPDRDILEFSLIPLDEMHCEQLYGVLSMRILSVRYTDPYSKSVKTRTMRLDGNLSFAFGLLSVNGKHYYKGKTIRLRAN